MNTYYPLAQSEQNTGLAKSVLCAVSFNFCEVQEKAEALLVMKYLMAEQQRMWKAHVARRFVGAVEVAERPKSKYRLGIDAYLGQEEYEDAWYERRARDIVENPKAKVFAPEVDHTSGTLSAESYKRTATGTEKRYLGPSDPYNHRDTKLVAKYREDFGMSYEEWSSLVLEHGALDAMSLLPRHAVKHLTGLGDEELDDIFGTDAAQKTTIGHLINRK